MRETKEERINRLSFETLLSILFIIASILVIFGDEKQKSYLETNQKEDEEKSSELYFWALIITLLIYGYFAYRNYKFYVDTVDVEDKEFLAIRFYGSVLLVIGILCIIYYEVNAKHPRGSIVL